MEEIHSLQKVFSEALTLNSVVSDEVVTVLCDIRERLGRLESCITSTQNMPQLERANQPKQLINNEEHGCCSLPTSEAPLMLISAPCKPEINEEALTSTSEKMNSQDAGEKSKGGVPSDKDGAIPSDSGDKLLHFPNSEHPISANTDLEPLENSITVGIPSTSDAPGNKGHTVDNDVAQGSIHSPSKKSLVVDSPGSLSGVDLTAKPSNPSTAPGNSSEGFVVSNALDSFSMKSTGSEHSIRSTPTYSEYDANGKINISSSESIRSISCSKLGSFNSCSDANHPMVEQFHEVLDSSSLYLESEDIYRKFMEVCRSGPSNCGDLETMLIPSDSIEGLREIVARLNKEGAIGKCLETYSNRRCRELQRNLELIGVENLPNEAFETFGWDALETRMREWMEHMQIFVKVLLHAEKLLCYRIFVELNHLRKRYFAGIIESSLMGMLWLGRDMASCKKSPEKVTVLLEMYDCVNRLKPEIEAVVDCEGLLLRQSASVFLREHGNVIKETLIEFAKLVRCDAINSHPCQELLPLGNKNNFLSSVLGKEIYAEILHLVYQDSPENGISGKLKSGSSVFLHLLRALIDNLEKRSCHFLDDGGKQVFLMNNLNYIAAKVSCSEVKDLIGDEWLRQLKLMINEKRILLLKYIISKFQLFIHSDRNDTSGLAIRLAAFNAAIEDLFALREFHVIPDQELQNSVISEISSYIDPKYSKFLNEFKNVILKKCRLSRLLIYRPEDIKFKLTECFPLQ